VHFQFHYENMQRRTRALRQRPLRSLSGKKRRTRPKSLRGDDEKYQLAIAENIGTNLFGTRINNPLPTRLKATMLYYDYKGLNPGAGLNADQVFAANGLFDVDITNVGHQPRGFDQIIALYDHYVVIGSKVEVTFSSIGDTRDIICGVTLRDSNTSLAAQDQTDPMESPFTSYGVLRAEAGPVVKVVQTFSPKFLGRSKYLSDPDLKGDATTNPNEMGFYHVWCSAFDNGDGGAVRAGIRITFEVVFIEPKTPGQS